MARTLRSKLILLPLLVVLFASTVNATYVAAKQNLTLTGIGSAPACPAGWSEIVAQTSAGTLAPVTAITTTGSINQLTALATVSASPLTAITTFSLPYFTGIQLGAASGGANATAATGTTTGNVATGGTTTAYTVSSTPTFTGTTFASGGTATTYTYYYRVCEK